MWFRMDDLFCKQNETIKTSKGKFILTSVLKNIKHTDMRLDLMNKQKKKKNTQKFALLLK